MYTLGVINLQQRAIAEQLYYGICKKVRDLLSLNSRAQREIMDELNEKSSNLANLNKNWMIALKEKGKKKKEVLRLRH